jgi:hypothetical protein
MGISPIPAYATPSTIYVSSELSTAVYCSFYNRSFLGEIMLSKLLKLVNLQDGFLLDVVELLLDAMRVRFNVIPQDPAQRSTKNRYY